MGVYKEHPKKLNPNTYIQYTVQNVYNFVLPRNVSSLSSLSYNCGNIVVQGTHGNACTSSAAPMMLMSSNRYLIAISSTNKSRLITTDDLMWTISLIKDGQLLKERKKMVQTHLVSLYCSIFPRSWFFSDIFTDAYLVCKLHIEPCKSAKTSQSRVLKWSFEIDGCLADLWSFFECFQVVPWYFIVKNGWR